eukprot:SAG22_NODE_7450_length_738_cov_1.453834_1_plen_205_part_01
MLSALAVDIVKPVAYPAMVAKIYENRDKFTDIETYDKSRNDIYLELAVLAAECGVEEEPFLKTLMLNTAGGQKNGGNGATGALKLCVKHARQRGVHVTPTCAVNGIVCDTSSGWSLDEWKAFLAPLVGWEPASSDPADDPAAHKVALTVRSGTNMVGGLSDDRLPDEAVNALFDDAMKASMGVPADTTCCVLKYATQVVAGKMYF